MAARFPDAGLLRRHERTQLTGTCWFSLGASLTTAAFTPALATTALVMLTLGDMAAALVGVAIGGETVVVKLGRAGKKSVEGSAAMFFVCFSVGSCVLHSFGVVMFEYVALAGAAAATVTELYCEEVAGVDDNVAIPLVSAAAMSLARGRVAALGITNA